MKLISHKKFNCYFKNCFDPSFVGIQTAKDRRWLKKKKYCALQPLFTSIWTRFIWLLCGSSEWGDGVSREFWLLSVWARLFSSKNYHCFQIFTMFLLLLCCIILVENKTIKNNNPAYRNNASEISTPVSHDIHSIKLWYLAYQMFLLHNPILKRPLHRLV